jgi:hypothetical protein
MTKRSTLSFDFALEKDQQAWSRPGWSRPFAFTGSIKVGNSLLVHNDTILGNDRKLKSVCDVKLLSDRNCT